jgi:hypothetical protein
MLDRIHEYGKGRLDLGNLVDDLRGLYVEADPHDARIRDEFESKWVRLDHENELRTEAWAPHGAANDVVLVQYLGGFHDWVEGVLAQPLHVPIWNRSDVEDSIA